MNSVYFEGNAFIDGGQVHNTDVLYASIQQSSLDMNMQNITSVKDPIQPQDAATKKYVDNLYIIFQNITLSGTNYTKISDNLKGSYNITINNTVDFSPTATFYVSKSHPSKSAHIVRHTCAPGIQGNTLVLLEIRWLPNQGIFLRKTAAPFDGVYESKIM